MRLPVLCCLALTAFIATRACADPVTIHNDFYWTDDEGHPLLTRSGCIARFDDTYYWYGGDQRGFREQHCYTSKDLVHWKHRGVVLRNDTETNRIDVLLNRKTRQYVMFLKYDGNGALLAIATADAPAGPFTLRDKMLIDGGRIGDMSMFQDDDGAAYLCYTSWVKGANAQHGIYRMSDDYLKPQQRVYLWDSGGREAPHLFKRGDLYYYGTSRTAWIDSSETAYYTARHLEGPWSAAKPMHTPGSDNSWDTQCDFVLPLRGTRGTVYLYAGDRWLKDRTAGRNGDYTWLPMEFDGDTPVVNYQQDWELDAAAGAWQPFQASRSLAANKPVTASSERPPHLAACVTAPKTFRDFAAKYWESDAADPQWISVDLERPAEFNRLILKWGVVAAKSFTVESSNDRQTWSKLLNWDKAASLGVTDVQIPLTRARYVRVSCLGRAPLPPSPGRRIISTPNSTQPTEDPSSKPAAAPQGHAGYALFDLMVLKD